MRGVTFSWVALKICSRHLKKSVFATEGIVFREEKNNEWNYQDTPAHLLLFLAT